MSKQSRQGNTVKRLRNNMHRFLLLPALKACAQSLLKESLCLCIYQLMPWMIPSPFELMIDSFPGELRRKLWSNDSRLDVGCCSYHFSLPAFSYFLWIVTRTISTMCFVKLVANASCRDVFRERLSLRTWHKREKLMKVYCWSMDGGVSVINFIIFRNFWPWWHGAYHHSTRDWGSLLLWYTWWFCWRMMPTVMVIAVKKCMANIGTSILRLFPTRLFPESCERRDGTRVHCIACAARDDLLAPQVFRATHLQSSYQLVMIG